MNNREIAHRWAQCTTTNGKGSHFYFEGDRLYSYGPHFLLARLFPSSDRGEICLMNCRGYSATTAKHKSYARAALNSAEWEIIEVPNPEGNAEDHHVNLAYLISEQKEVLKDLEKARINTSIYLDYSLIAERRYRQYVRRFNIKKAPKLPQLTKKARASYAKKALAQEAKAALARIQRQEKETAAAVLDFEAWKQGASNTIKQGFYLFPVALRRKGDLIETSRGASVPFAEGLKAFNIWKTQAGYIAPATEIGAYSVKSSDLNGVKIGCHDISAAELDRFFSENKE